MPPKGRKKVTVQYRKLDDPVGAFRAATLQQALSACLQQTHATGTIGDSPEAGWSIVVPLWWVGAPEMSFDLARILNGMIAASLALVLVRAFAVATGIASLLQLSAELALSEARERDEERHRAAKETIKGLPERDGFGTYVELTH